MTSHRARVYHATEWGFGGNGTSEVVTFWGGQIDYKRPTKVTPFKRPRELSFRSRVASVPKHLLLFVLLFEKKGVIMRSVVECSGVQWSAVERSGV